LDDLILWGIGSGVVPSLEQIEEATGLLRPIWDEGRGLTILFSALWLFKKIDLSVILW